MVTSLQNAIKALMVMKATARPESGKAGEIESIIQQIILGERMLSEQIEQQADLINELGADSAFLNALESAGVNNWEGYEVAYDTIHEQEQITNPE